MTSQTQSHFQRYLLNAREFVKSQFFFDAGKVFVANLLASVLSFIGSILTVRVLSVNEFGLLASYTNILSIITGTVLGGVNTALVRYVSLYSKNDLKKAKILTKLILRFEIVLGTVFFFITMLFARPIAEQFFHQPLLIDLIRWLGVGVFTVFLTSYFQTIFQAEQKFNRYVAFVVLQAAVALGGTIILFFLNLLTPLNLVLASILTNAILLPFYFAYFQKSPLSQTSGLTIQKTFLSEIIHYTKWLTIASVATFLFLRLDVFMLTTMTSLEVVAHYSFANVIYLNILLLLNAINTILLPKISGLEKMSEIYANAKKILKTSLLIAVAVVPGFFFIKPVALFIFGDKYIDSFPILYIMLIGLFFSLALNPVANFVFTLKLEKYFALVSISILVLHITGNIIFIPLYEGYGAAVVTVVSIIIGNIALVWKVFAEIHQRLQTDSTQHQAAQSDDAKKTLLVITELYPNADNPFLGTFVKGQIDELKKMYRVVVIVPFLMPIQKHTRKNNTEHVRDGDIDVYYVKEYPLWIFVLRVLKFVSPHTAAFLNKNYISKKVLSLAQTLHRKYQFSLVHGHEVYIGDEAGPIGKQLQIPSIITIHGLFEYHQSLFGKKVMSKIIPNLSKTNRLITVSRVAASSYQQNGVNREIDIIPNGLNEDIFKSVQPIPEKWQKIIHGKTVILTVGFFVKEKRFEQVIEAAARLKEKHGDSFVVLMIGRGELEGYYKKLIKEKNLENHVHIVGQIPPSEMMSYYRASDFLIHPSVIESFSMACLEAASAGKPFICTSNIGFAEYITPNKEAFVIPPDNIGELADKMSLLLKEATLCKQMGLAAKEMSQYFSNKHIAKKIIRIYDEANIKN